VVKPDLVAPGNLIDSLYFAAETLNQEYPGFVGSLFSVRDQRHNPAFRLLLCHERNEHGRTYGERAAALMLETESALTAPIR